MNAVSFEEFFRAFAKIGLLSFGGPAGQIALMHRVLVDEKQWLDEKRFLHALNFCMLLPGPEAMQLATYCGWLMRGVKGGLIAGGLFVVPGALVLLMLSMLYVTFGNVPLVAGILFGLKAGVLAIVLQALIKVSKRALKGNASYAVAIAAFIALAFFKLPFPLVIFAAALIGLMFSNVFASKLSDLVPEPVVRPIFHIAKVISWGVVFWGLPVFALMIWLERGNVFVDEALFFSKAAVVTFGGAYAVLAYVGQQAVDMFGWLKPDEMLTGLGLAETTPGPLILVLVFVGFVGAFRDAGSLDPLVAGTLGAMVTLWVTFVPCFLWIFMGAPFIEALRGNQLLSAALAAITAAVVGVIANLSIWFAVHVLFKEVDQALFGWASLDLPIWSTFDWRAALIALFALVMVFRNFGLFAILLACTVSGIALFFLT